MDPTRHPAALFPGVKISGLDHGSDSERLREATPVPLRAAVMNHQHGADWHLALGLVHIAETGEAGPWQPRVNKGGLPTLAEKGLEWRLHLAAVDVDREPHGPLDPTWADEERARKLDAERAAILEAVASLETPDGDAAWPLALWPTRGGWRLLWHLSEPLAIRTLDDYERAKGHLAGLIAALRVAGLDGRHGLAADEKCKEPNRLFRLAHVERDGVPTWEADYMTLGLGVEWDPSARALDLTSIEPAVRERPSPAPAADSGARGVPVDEALEALGQLAPEMRDRVVGWAEGMLRNEADRIRNTSEGGRNDKSFRVIRDVRRWINVDALPDEAMDRVREAMLAAGLPEGEVDRSIDYHVAAAVNEGPDVNDLVSRLRQKDESAERLVGSYVARRATTRRDFAVAEVREVVTTLRALGAGLPEQVLQNHARASARRLQQLVNAGALETSDFEGELLEELVRLGLGDETAREQVRSACEREERSRDLAFLDSRDYAEVISELPEFEPNDTFNGRVLAELLKGRAHYVADVKQWAAYDGRRWAMGPLAEVIVLARTGEIRFVLQEMAREAHRRAKELEVKSATDDGTTSEADRDAAAKWAKQHATSLRKAATDAGNMRRRRAAMDAMAAEPRVPMQSSAFDVDEFAFNVENGTIDLRTGELRPHNPRDLVTKLAPVEFDPSARGPEFERFIRWAVPDEEVRRYLQRRLGMALLGRRSEQRVDLLLGGGGNGKSTLLDLVLHVVGDYGVQAPPKLLARKQKDSNHLETHTLRGRRLVVASEVQEGASFDEELLKQLTGDEFVNARGNYENYSSFRQSADIFLAANHRPIVKGTDDAIWRRINLVPFESKIDGGPDRALPERLRAEASAVLSWLVQGCLDTQREGNPVPEQVAARSRDYRRESDVLGRFIEDEMVENADGLLAVQRVYQRWRSWCNDTNIAAGSYLWFAKRLGERVETRNATKRNTSHVIGWGLRSGA